MSQPIILASNAQCDAQLSRRIRNKLSIMLKRAGDHSDLVDPMLLACTEHLANLYQHSDSPTCDIFWFVNERTLEIHDNGQSIDALLSCASKIDTSGVPLLKESGMGLSLITTLFPDFQYIPSGPLSETNCLRLPLPVPVARVVVVDDDPVFLSLVTAYLVNQYSVDAFSTPKAALNSQALSTAAMVICDVHMPEISGYEFREHLLNSQKTALIPFLFITGDDSDGQRLQASAWQIDDFLVKPLEKSTLLATIQRVLLRSRRLQMQLNDQIDETVNRSLWPKGPWNSPNYSVTYDYVVAERGGGDFLCHITMPFGHRYVLGDVMGHGEQAKFFAFALTGFLSGLSESIDSTLNPEDFLTALSRQMCLSALLVETVATLQIVDVHDDGQLNVCSAGHPAPFILKKERSLSSIAVNGVLPGLDIEASYTSIQVMLDPGDSLFCYTDGLIEALLYQNDEAALSAELKQLMISGIGFHDANSLAEHWSFTKRLLDDDVSLLVIHRFI
jgi:CheY-like chemotaxis protein/anti-sigma regulatory factor (Ser/Thr protein kinase)